MLEEEYDMKDSVSSDWQRHNVCFVSSHEAVQDTPGGKSEKSLEIWHEKSSLSREL